MNGRLAVLFLILGFGDMGANHCGDGGGCFQRLEAEPRLSIGISEVKFQEHAFGHETYMSVEADHSFGPFKPVYAGSVSGMGDVWGGAGFTWEHEWGPIFVTSTLIPGLWIRGEGPNLGSPLEFRSILGFGLTLPGGKRLAITYDHRSNGDTRDINPGLETWSYRVSQPLD